ncbi:type II toxin-antitoxin system RelE/ParE family toxin [Aequorivita viscosa]|uniref:mRNA interferase YafQ n=1 Tax=Aequorivita viscosa TaxID=797419 RepID=A0A1M6BXM1_9FLAO|nr:type II toxin-antitoxin system YafQ family toxin [Aequorivita viscosa]SDW21312.1 mRNA interferase YafQ [Aequorivita viscosa]SHI53470.1 mRNA interferase YafQ [Aequorivita viscosa]
MYNFIFTTKFKKDFKKLQKRNMTDVNLAVAVLDILRANGVKGIPPTMTTHKLKGKYEGDWECHIKPDLLIIWFQIESPKTIKLIRIGSYSELFE